MAQQPPRASVREEGEKLTRRNIIAVVGLIVGAVGLFAALGVGAMKVAQADQWPTRPITMVVPFAAGGPTDVVGRIVADRLSDALGQQVIVENIGGAGGMNGAQRVAVASPGGYPGLPGPGGPRAYNQGPNKNPPY